MKRGASGLILAVGTALVAATPAFAEPVSKLVAEVSDTADVLRDGDRFIHRASGYIFPSSLGDMPARKVTVFGPGDVSVQYTVKGGAGGDAWVDLYVYPADGEAIETAGAGVVDAIARNFRATPALAPEGTTVDATGLQSGWFDGRVREMSLKTGFYLVKRGDWLIKIRATMPSPPPAEMVRRTAAAIAAANLGPLPSQP
ncbi:hypothetical protein [Sphingopyxis sp. H115]|uniref:hypothetical protein n=1 Tax=Sphingopyxis sp. H115 TaxID=1759073 RepID=UPI000736E63E|nr:hypothetical protein [Sphingopyxis sp. H115]KTE08207.1 hypothetical protein ATE71_14455 [Sphingopyxis sp. H115]